jgi:DNA-directed RNA polymerase subunit M/transcription elongation factor TFIIS
VKFCDECGSLLVPKVEKKSDKVLLVCRKCGNTVTPDATEKVDYVIESDLNHVNREKINVFKEPIKKVKRITDEDREAFEDFFEDDSGVEIE